jgi:hypothetical protein
MLFGQAPLGDSGRFRQDLRIHTLDIASLLSRDQSSKLKATTVKTFVNSTVLYARSSQLGYRIETARLLDLFPLFLDHVTKPLYSVSVWVIMLKHKLVHTNVQTLFDLIFRLRRHNESRLDGGSSHVEIG